MANSRPFALSISILFILLRATFSSDVTILIAFKATISDPNGFLGNWAASANSGPCTRPTWTGVICDPKGAVFGLQLENMNLAGKLDLDPLTDLPEIRTLSFANNNFEGPMPDLKKFEGLKSIFVASNKLSGEIADDAFQGMDSLKKIDLSGNAFSGPIPSSLVGVEKLLELRMENNKFGGEIPDFQQTGLKVVNVSNNNLEGKIPESLSKMDASMFAGNKDLCGPPLSAQCKPIVLLPPPSPSPPLSPSSSTSKKLSTPLIIAIAVISIGVVLALIGAVVAMTRRKHEAEDVEKLNKVEPYKTEKVVVEQRGSTGKMTAAAAVPAVPAATKEEKEQGRLVFVREDRRERFELQDLLRASAEVLGNGEFGSSYKAGLVDDGVSVVVKRFKEMSKVGKEDFQEHMRRLGRLTHPNLLPLLAYYYRKEEKLLVTDYIPCGNLTTLLHGNRGPNTPTLDWAARLKIVKGIARGLNYLYEELAMLNAPHGHLKSSNVLLNASFEPILTDYALGPVLNQNHASQTMIAYKSPECRNSGRLSKKSDVWSLGVLILEILTGKHPGNYSQQGKGGSDLANWVNSVVREEWTGEVFDSEMRRTRNAEGEMLNLLQIGLGCCEANVEKRWELSRAVEMIEELKERDGDEDCSSLASEGEVTSSKAVTDDDFSFSMNN